MLQVSVLIMNRLRTTESAIFIYLMRSLPAKDLTIQNISTAASVVPCGAVKRLPVHHDSADYIFWFI